MFRAARLLCLGFLASSLVAQPPARPAITGIAFFRAYTTHVADAETFYGPTMGFPELKSKDEDGTLVFPINKSQWVEVLPNTPPPQPNVRLAAVGFTTRNAAALEQYLNGRGVKTAELMRDGQFAVRDPEGNLVYFVESPYPAAAGKTALSGIPKLVAEAQPLPSATSQRMIHVGFMVHDAAREDAFWREILGFRPYWHGGMNEQRTDWVSLQVPDGTDWLEYMLNPPPNPDLRGSGMSDHFSLGTPLMQEVMARLQANHCEGKQCVAIQAGRDGKIQLNLFDPDQTRVEYMEFKPVLKPCCSPILGAAPGPKEVE